MNCAAAMLASAIGPAPAPGSTCPTGIVVLPVALVTFPSVFAYHSFAAIVRSRLNGSSIHVDRSARVANVAALNLVRLKLNQGKLESSKKRGQNKEADDLIHGDVTQLRGRCAAYIRRTREPHTKCLVWKEIRFIFICRRGEKASVIYLSNSNSAYFLSSGFCDPKQMPLRSHIPRSNTGPAVTVRLLHAATTHQRFLVELERSLISFVPRRCVIVPQNRRHG